MKGSLPWTEEDNRILREYTSSYNKSIAFRKASEALKRTIGACAAHYYDITRTKLVTPKPISPITISNDKLILLYNRLKITVEGNKFTVERNHQITTLIL